jgi:hypothetical protein
MATSSSQVYNPQLAICMHKLVPEHFLIGGDYSAVACQKGELARGVWFARDHCALRHVGKSV